MEQLGFRASEVDDILVTHLHWDHAGGMKELAHATFWVDAVEWDFANSLSSAEAVPMGYVQSDFRALESRVSRLELTDDIDPGVGFDVFGDGSVEAVPLRGHSPGHVGYRFRLTDGTTVFFVADAVFSIPQITEERPLGIFPRLVAANLDTARLTMWRLRDWWRCGDQSEILVASHDFDWGERCVDGPVPLHSM